MWTILTKKEKNYEKDKFDSFVISDQQRANLRYTINLILDFNETIELDLFWKYKNKKMNEWF